jgi:hypothetical protein
MGQRRETAGLCALALLLCAILLAGPKQLLTGDEPRYLIYSLSFWKTGGFAATLHEWQRLLFEANGVETGEIPHGVDGTPTNGIYLPVVMSPIAGVFSLAGLRLATLIAGLIGLFHLNRLCKRVSAPGTALIVTWIAAITMPLLPYLHLFYMETFLFAFICCGWERLQRSDRGPGGDLITAAIILAIPFIHLRGSVVAALLYCLLLWQLHRRGLGKRKAVFALLGVSALIALTGLNLAIYGRIDGPINVARPPRPSEWFSNTAMQLFNVRHGLLAYAPIWVLGSSGLILGAVRGGAIARQGLILAAIVVATALGPNPGECWPARFWVQSIPMLAVGLCIWWQAARLPLLRFVAIVLLALTLLNTALFVDSPSSFLANRQTAETYQSVFDQLGGGLDLALILPAELDDPVNQGASRNFAIGSGLFALSMALAAARRRSLYALPAVLLLAAVADLAHVRLLPSSSYAATIEPNRVALALKEPMRAGYVQIGRPWEVWSGWWNQRRSFTVSTTADGQEVEAVRAANQVIPIVRADKISDVIVRSEDRFDVGSETRYRLRVYRSASMLRRWFPGIVGPERLASDEAALLQR